MFAKDLSNKIIINSSSLCLGAFVAILSGLSGLGLAGDSFLGGGVLCASYSIAAQCDEPIPYNVSGHYLLQGG
jgi:hypothetical protein